jgi:N-acetylglucosamine-6-phosphate deacetylase
MIIKNGRVLSPFEVFKDTDVIVENGVIVSLGNTGTEYENDKNIIDASGCYVCPGLVDIHTHGGGGGDFMDATEDSFMKALKFHVSNGTTSLLASSVTAPIDQILNMLEVIRKFKDAEKPVCRVLGAHLEGPFLSEKKRGAHKSEYLLIPKENGYDFIIDNSDIVVNVTLSPELPSVIELTKELVRLGIVVSGGHDDSRKSEIMPVIDAGLTNLTHIFCAMSTVTMRDGIRSVGLTEIGLIDDRLSVELIADNHHLPPELVKLAYKCKGPRKACVVSDSLRASGMPTDGTIYTLGANNDKDAQKFIVADDVAILLDGSRYAGSVQPISRMIKNLVDDCDIPLLDAVCMASYTPAKIIHKEHLIGSISPGKMADFCILDNNLNVVKTIVGGEIVFDIQKGGNLSWEK